MKKTTFTQTFFKTTGMLLLVFSAWLFGTSSANAQCGCYKVNVTLNEKCQFKLTSNIASDGRCGELRVRVKDGNPGNLDTVDCVGTYVYGLFNENGDVVCWGEVTAVDELGPKLICAAWYDPTKNGKLYCFDVNYTLNNPLTIGRYSNTTSAACPSPRPAAGTTQQINNAEGVTPTSSSPAACSGLAVPNLASDNVRNLGYTFFRDNCFSCGCRTTIKWTDKVVFWNCDQQKENGGVYATIYREWVGIDCKGNITDTVQTIPFYRPEVDDFAFTGAGRKGDASTPGYDWVVEYNACSPDKSVIKYEDVTPSIDSWYYKNIDGQRRRIYLDKVECNYSTQIKDFEFPICNGNGVKIDRSIFVFDWCKGGIVDTIKVLIKIGDFKAPYLELPERDIVISTGPADATASFPISIAGIFNTFGVKISDNCKIGNATVKVTSRNQVYNGIIINTKPTYNEAWFDEGYAIMNGTMLRVPLGEHKMIIDAFDGCYNASRDSFVFKVVDRIAPVMVVDDDLHVSLSNAIVNDLGQFKGYARVDAEDIDEGSWDNVGLKRIGVRRNVPAALIPSFIARGYDLNNDGVLDDKDGFEVVNGMLMTPKWAKFVEFFCGDLNADVTIELWGEDFAGNTNYAWMTLTIEDKLAPTLMVPEDITIDCDDPCLGNIDDKKLSAECYGDIRIMTGNDCAGYDTTYRTVKTLKCGYGKIERLWTITKKAGLRNVAEGKQVITILPIHQYDIRFPKDEIRTDCTKPSPDTLITDELSCDILAVNITDKRYDAADDECYKIFRTYSIINWCAYDEKACGPDPMANGVVTVIDRKWTDDGLIPVWLLVRDRNRDGYNELFLSRNRTPREGALADGIVSDKNGQNDEEIGYNTDTEVNYCGNDPYDYSHSWMYTQIIKVYDEVRPVATGPATAPVFPTDPNTCVAKVTIPVKATDNCTDVVEWETAQTMIDVNGLADGSGPFVMQNNDLAKALGAVFTFADDKKGGLTVTVTNLPEGKHDLIVVVRDECGNLSYPTRIPFEVKDTKGPAPICINGLSAELMPGATAGTGMAAVWATDFIASKIYDCNGQGPEKQGNLKLVTKYSINRVGQPKNADQTGLTFDCAEKGKVVQVEIHAWDTKGNDDFCVTFIEVQDNRKVCPASLDGGTIAGTISTEGSANLQGATINLSGSESGAFSTASTGGYSFVNLKKGGDYTITPQLDKNHLNGVSTFDLVLISKHILNITPLNTPYKMIAADVNNSKTVTTADLIALRKLILNIDQAFANNTSWRFVDAAYRFPNASNPWAAVFPEVVNINNLAANVNANFVAIKVGDVNASAAVNAADVAEVRTAGKLDVSVANQALKAGQEVSVEFSAADLASLQGYQFALNFDRSKVELVDLVAGVAKSENFGVFAGEGVITTSWNGTAKQGALFTLVLRAKADAQLSDVLSLNNRVLNGEAYDAAGEQLAVNLKFDGKVAAATGFELLQNTPNPFNGETVIGFNLPKAGAATLTISDVNGRILNVNRAQFVKGYNQVILKAEDLKATGVLYYTLEADDFTATKKMIIVE